jgi:hypothetical protein
MICGIAFVTVYGLFVVFMTAVNTGVINVAARWAPS